MQIALNIYSGDSRIRQGRRHSGGRVVGVLAGWLGLLQKKKLIFGFIYSEGYLGKHTVSKSPTFIHRREPERVLPGGSVSGSCNLALDSHLLQPDINSDSYSILYFYRLVLKF